MEEIERAAVTILYQADTLACHPVLHMWIQALIHDPNEHRFLNQYAEDGDWKTEENERIIAARGWKLDNVLHAVIGSGEYPESLPRHWHIRDEANARLAIALANYRREGRPQGDTSHTIQGMGGPLLRVTTSLAAAVSEYVMNIQNWWANQLNLEEEGED